MTTPHLRRSLPDVERGGLLAAALGYRALGFSVIPISPGTKKPALKSWEQFQAAPADEAMIRKWWGKDNGQGVGVVLGKVSGGLICRDFDRLDSFRSWTKRHPQVAKQLPVVATSRGRHVYARLTPKAFCDFDQAFVKFDDGELRIRNCYCLLPPSVHPCGVPYSFVRSFDSIPFVEPDRVGFLEKLSNATERTEKTERTELTEKTEREQKQWSESVNESNFKNEIERAIQETLPTEPGKRHRLVFDLARRLKSIAGIAEAPAIELESVVKQWHGQALPFIATKPFEETLIDFVNAWDRVKFPAGREPIRAALERAKQSKPPLFAESFEQAEFRLLAALCRELQRSAGSEPFFLSCRTAAGLLAVDHTTVWRWFVLLKAKGIVVETEKGNAITKRASRYRYVGD